MRKMFVIEAVRSVTTTATTPEGSQESASLSPGDRIDLIGAVRTDDDTTQFVGANLTEFSLPNDSFRFVYAR